MDVLSIGPQNLAWLSAEDVDFRNFATELLSEEISSSEDSSPRINSNTFLSLPADNLHPSRDEVETISFQSFLQPTSASKTNNSSQPQVPTEKRKAYRITRRRSTNAAFLPELRIFKRDIRRRYGDMLTNVCNSDNFDLKRKFYEIFTVPDCQAIDTVPEGITTLSSFRSVSLQGRESIFQYRTLMCTRFIPDIVATFYDVQVRKRSDERGSRVIMRLRFNGTQIYELDDGQGVKRLSSAPCYVQLEGWGTLYLDEAHRIVRFESIGEHYSERPVMF